MYRLYWIIFARNARSISGNLKMTLTELQIAYKVDPMIVRGLDYYSKTVFEIIYTNSQNESLTVCGGGRYDGLTKQMGIYKRLEQALGWDLSAC